MSREALAVTVIGGYLGAGKTTLVNHLLRHAHGLRIAVLVNEFGELPIDQDLIEAQEDNIISIAGGCVCCSYGNDLTLAMLDLLKLDPPPEHVLLESSGVAIPAAIASSLSLLNGYRLDGIIVLANAETIVEQLQDNYIGDTVARQLQDADLLVLNKTDLVSAQHLQACIHALREHAANSEILQTRYGELPLQIVLQPFLDRPRSAPATHRATLFKSFSLPLRGPLDANTLAAALANPDLGLIRAKGFVTGADGERLSIQLVGRRYSISPAPDGVSDALVLIGHSEGFDAQAVKELIERHSVLQ